MKHVLAVTGSVADWGLMDCVLQPMLGLVHLTVLALDSYDLGPVYETSPDVEILRMSSADDSMVEFAARSAKFVSNFLQRHQKPWDAVVVLGDRVEVVSAVVGLRTLKSKVHHLYAGDCSGCVDDAYRDAISAMSTYLYVVSNQSRGRAVDLMLAMNGRIEDVICCTPEYPIDESSVPPTDYAVARWHPETSVDETVLVGQWIQEAAGRAFVEGIPLYIFPPNKDDGWQAIEFTIDLMVRKYPSIVSRLSGLSRAQYLGLLKNARWIRGNSSSFALEAPVVCSTTEIILDGRRQWNRAEPSFLKRDKFYPTMSAALLERILS